VASTSRRADATRWHKSIPHPSDIDQFFAPIVADDYRVQAMQAGRVTSGDEFLTAIDAVFIYLLRPFAKLVAASGDSGVGIYSYVIPSNSGQSHFTKAISTSHSNPFLGLRFKSVMSKGR
jgi:hypothetical protein